MIKYFLRLLLLVGAIVGVFAVIGSMLPRAYSFETEIEIEASPETIFPKINSLERWQDWSRQWNPAEIEGLEIRYSGESSGIGATQTWTDIRGDGKLWITESTAHQSVKYESLFANFPKMTSEIVLIPVEGKTRVKWSSSGRLPGGPFYGFFGSFFSIQMKAEYERSLEKLKTGCEPVHKEPGT